MSDTKEGTWAEGAGVRVRLTGRMCYTVYREGKVPLHLDLRQVPPTRLVRAVEKYYGSVDDFIYGTDEDDRLYKLLLELALRFKPSL